MGIVEMTKKCNDDDESDGDDVDYVDWHDNNNHDDDVSMAIPPTENNDVDVNSKAAYANV